MIRSALLAAAVVCMLMQAQIKSVYSAEDPSAVVPQVRAVAGHESGEGKILTLEQCIDLAFEKNPGLRIEQEKIVELENEYHIASAGLYPKITASAYVTRLGGDRIGALPNMAYTEESLGQVKVGRLLFDGGKTGNNVRAVLKAADAQRDFAEASRLDTIYLVSQAYYRVLEARELLRVGQNSYTQREAFYKLTESFHKAGKATRIEALKAEAQLLDAERSLIQVREALRISKLILKKTIGAGVETRISVADGLPDAFAEPEAEETLLTQMYENNSDLKKSAQFKDQARLSLDSARGSYLPEISLQGTYGYRDRDVGGSGDEWSAGVFLEWSLFEGGLTRAQVAKARARFRELEWNEKAVQDQVRVDLSQALGDIRTALASIRSSKRLEEAQEEAYKAIMAFYKRGKATYIEVLTAETDQTQAKAAYVRSIGDYQAASTRLDRITGKRHGTTENQGGLL